MMRNPRRQAAWNLTSGTCFYCRRPMQEDSAPAANHLDVMELDHKIATAIGGTDLRDNHAPACAPCNAQKGKKTPEQYRQYLIKFGIISQFFGEQRIERDWLLVHTIPRSELSSREQTRKRFKAFRI
jgi:hypothetical protein